MKITPRNSMPKKKSIVFKSSKLGFIYFVIAQELTQ